jgi:hypothetical protein
VLSARRINAILGGVLTLYACLGYDAVYFALLALNATLQDIETINAEVRICSFACL